MDEIPALEVRAFVDSLYREESRQVFATLVRLLGSFDLAEEALHEAFAAAVAQWNMQGIPKNPRAWLVSAGRFKAIDTLRRRSRFDSSLHKLTQKLEEAADANTAETLELPDDRLRLIFTCCHPALAASTQVALTLREICGLTTEEIASAFLVSPATIAQRIVRGKAKIRDAGIPYQVPEGDELPQRLESVLSVVYLVFNEGYSASSGDQLTRPDLSQEAIRLGRLLARLLPDAEAFGLLALLLLHESRRESRSTESGDLILLEDQDRSRWNSAYIAEGLSLVTEALTTRNYGVYTIQAAISAAHATAATAEETNWGQIVTWYDLLYELTHSPVVELNRAVAVGMKDGAASGLNLIEGILNRGDLTDYHLAYAARADFYRRSGQPDQAKASYLRALELVRQEPERRFLERRLAETKR